MTKSDHRILQFGGVSSHQLSREDTSSMEDENHSCQDEELVINTLMTEPELVDIQNPAQPARHIVQVDDALLGYAREHGDLNDSYEDLANRVKRQYELLNEDSLIQQHYSSVENGEVHDEYERADSRIKVEERESNVSESEVRDEEDEFAYSDA